jgi:hypothetical protein
VLLADIACAAGRTKRGGLLFRPSLSKFRALLAAGILAGASAVAVPSGSSGAATVPAATVTPRVFAYYYLWWSADHWRGALGSHYPFAATALPLPAVLDASGCHPRSLYRGNSLTDVPRRIYSQDDPGFIEADVRQAASAGIAGFAVNWVGTGAAQQGVNSNPYNRRLKLMVDAVHRVNSAGIPFALWLSYKASAAMLSRTAMTNDLNYFVRTYGRDSAFDRKQSARLTMIWQGSRKYPAATLQVVSAAFRSKMRLLGDETNWSTARGRFLDGDAYYWSSQDPWGNPQSFGQLGQLASSVRKDARNPDGSSKAWIAPVTPGYDTQLAGGTSCVSRRGGLTLKRLFAGNAATKPQAFALISWNEVTEATYIDPMTRYGTRDLDVLRGVIKAGV